MGELARELARFSLAREMEAKCAMNSLRQAHSVLVHLASSPTSLVVGALRSVRSLWESQAAHASSGRWASAILQTASSLMMVPVVPRLLDLGVMERVTPVSVRISRPILAALEGK